MILYYIEPRQYFTTKNCVKLNIYIVGRSEQNAGTPQQHWIGWNTRTLGKNKPNNKTNNNSNRSKGYIVISYTEILCESIHTYIEGNRTLKNILVTPKDKDTLQQKVT